MPQEQNNIEIYSEEVQDILENRPNWIIRNSILSIFLILVIVISISFIIKYPESADIQGLKIETQTPSYQFVSQNSGNLKLLVENGKKVNEGEWIALIEKNIKYNDLVTASKFIENTDVLVSQNNLEKIKVNTALNLGELEIYYSNFIKNLDEYRTFKSVDPSASRVDAYTQDLSNKKSALSSKDNEINSVKENLSILQKKVQNNEELYKKGYISKTDMDNIQREYNELKKVYHNLSFQYKTEESDIVQTAYKSKQTIADNKLNVSDLKRECINSFLVFKEEFSKWKEKNIFIAPYTGEVNFFNVWNSNKFTTVGEHLISLRPLSQDMLGNGLVSGKFLGKIKSEQKVIIKLDGYESTEYGFVTGKVKRVSSFPNSEGFYNVIVDLPSTLKTSYGTNIPFSPELRGKGEVILKDQTLFELFIKNVKKLIDNGNS